MRNKTKSLKTPPPTPSFFPGSTSLPISLPPRPPTRAGGWGVGIAISSSHVVSAAPSSSAARLLTLCPCFSTGSLPKETVFQELLQHESIPQAAILHKILHGVQCFRNRLLQLGSPAGSQVLPANLLQHRLPTGSQPPSGTPCSSVGSSLGCRWGICSPVGLHGCSDSLPHHGLLHGLQRNLCSGAWSTSCPSIFTDLGVCRVVALIYSHFFQLLHLYRFFSPFLTMLPRRCYHHCWWARPWPTVGHSGSFQELLRSHACSPAATKTLPPKTIHHPIRK